MTYVGETTRHRGLCSPGLDEGQEPWCAQLSPCQALAEIGIRHLGIVEAAEGYAFERSAPRHSLFLATLHGTGRAGSVPAIDLLPKGHGALLPKGHPTAYSNAGESPWHFAWVCFEPSCPLAAGAESARFPVDPWVFHCTLEALTASWIRYRNAAATQRMIDALMDLVKLHVRMRPELVSFHKAWDAVAADLGADWDLRRIARLGGCSQERFRLLCWDTYGISPIKHLTRLRLRKARTLLASTGMTVEEISELLGYADSYSLSHAFKKQFGISPRDYRKHPPSPDGASVSTGNAGV